MMIQGLQAATAQFLLPLLLAERAHQLKEELVFRDLELEERASCGQRCFSSLAFVSF